MALFGGGIDPNRYLYKYVGRAALYSHTMTDLRLRAAPLPMMNDPREARDWRVTLQVADAVPDPGDAFWEVQAAANIHLREGAKLLSFTRDDALVASDPVGADYLRGYGHPRMWEQYGESFRGAVLVLDHAELQSRIQAAAKERDLKAYHDEVRYSNHVRSDLDAFSLKYSEILRVGLRSALDNHQRNHAHSLYFFKSEDWAAEHEYRWVLVGGDKCEFFDFSTALVAVVLGDRCEGVPETVTRAHERGTSVARCLWQNGAPQLVPAM